MGRKPGPGKRPRKAGVFLWADSQTENEEHGLHMSAVRPPSWKAELPGSSLKVKPLRTSNYPSPYRILTLLGNLTP